jgi:hypothetical protein
VDFASSDKASGWIVCDSFISWAYDSGFLFDDIF